MKKTLPQYLQAGDKVAICATARGINAADLTNIVSHLEGEGLKVIFAESIGLHFGQLAGAIDVRARALQKLLDDPEIRAVFFARGGYGTVQIIDQLNWNGFNSYPKWLVGFSDLTALLNEMSLHTQTIGVHGPMGSTWATHTPESTGNLLDLLFGRQVPHMKFDAHPANRGHAMSGVLTGGNLSVLYSLSGTRSQVSGAGKILFLEDLDEYLYHIDRMMRNLSRTGAFEGLRGLLVGGMTGMHDNEVPYGKSAIAIIREIADDFKLPVAFGAPCGHQAENWPLLMGAAVEIQISKTNTQLKYLNLHG
jgi:muramoyltetrapeptide carboxypeptidase